MNEPRIWVVAAAAVAFFFVVTFFPDFGPKSRIPWRTDFAAAQAEAQRLHEPMLVDFTASWCGYCRQMEHTTWADKSVAEAAKNMVPVKIDVDSNRDLAQRYSVRPIPAYAILDENGNVQRFGEGYRQPSEFLAWLGMQP